MDLLLSTAESALCAEVGIGRKGFAVLLCFSTRMMDSAQSVPNPSNSIFNEFHSTLGLDKIHIGVISFKDSMETKFLFVFGKKNKTFTVDCSFA